MRPICSLGIRGDVGNTEKAVKAGALALRPAGVDGSQSTGQGVGCSPVQALTLPWLAPLGLR